MTLPMARDLAGQVRVCTIAPGFFGKSTCLYRTGRLSLSYKLNLDLTHTLPPPSKLTGTPMGNAVKDSNLEKHMIHPYRMGKPSEFAHLACAIIENSMMNGEIVRIDGAVRLGKL